MDGAIKILFLNVFRFYLSNYITWLPAINKHTITGLH